MGTSATIRNGFEESVSSGVSKQTSLPAGESCRYAFQKKGGTYGLTITTSSTQAVRDEGIFDSAADAFSKTKKALMASENGLKKFMAVQALGDNAFWNGTDLWILKGDMLAIITVRSVLEGSFKNMQEAETLHAGQNLALSREVAEKILAKMK